MPTKDAAGIGRPNAREISHPVAGLLEDGVAGCLRLRSQQRIKHANLRLAKADVVFGGSAHVGEQAVLLKPLLGKHAKGAVVQADGFFAAPQRRQKCGQLTDSPAEVRCAVQLEPVDAAGDVNLDFARLAVELPIGLDVPVFGGQLADDRQIIGSQFIRRVIDVIAGHGV